MIDLHLTSLVHRTKYISMTTVYRILSETEGPGPGPLVQNMVNIGPRPGAPRSQRVNKLFVHSVSRVKKIISVKLIVLFPLVSTEQ